jgi:hypothetical protein
MSLFQSLRERLVAFLPSEFHYNYVHVCNTGYYCVILMTTIKKKKFKNITIKN